MINEVKRHRSENVPQDAPVTLEERRARDKAKITTIIKQNKILLTSWTLIMDRCLRSKSNFPFRSLKSVKDHIDGWQMYAGNDQTGRNLQQVLKENGLDVWMPSPRKAPGHFWIKLKGGPYDLNHNRPLLEQACAQLHFL